MEKDLGAAKQNQNVSITSVEYRNYKAFVQFSVSLQDINVLVGVNNSGKSTLLGAFRALEVALKKARSRNPEYLYGPNGHTFGYSFPPESFPTALENVHTNYADVQSTVTFRLSNGNKLHLFFPEDGGWLLIPYTNDKPVRSVASFKEQYPVTVACVPVLGPVQHHEELLTYETVQRNLGTHLASSHFRNYWYHNPDNFALFADMVQGTWPGMEIERPELVKTEKPELAMYCREDRITREIFWAGFGFQIWCQLLTHLSRARDATILIVDEPEIYLHPDVQRQLLSLFRSLHIDVLLASHSPEIIADADPSEILLIDKRRQSAKRLRDVSGVQNVLSAIGSLHNLTLARLAQNRTLLFTEGDRDFDILRHFARKLGLNSLGGGSDFTPVTSDGFSSIDRVKALGWGLDRALGQHLKIAAIYDRDYYCAEHVANFISELQEHVDVAHIHARKEIENYLLVPNVLQRAVDRELAAKAQREGLPQTPAVSISELLDVVCDDVRLDAQSQYLAKRTEFYRQAKIDDATIVRETLVWFDECWRDLARRLCIVPGKIVLSSLRHVLQARHGITLTDHKIVDAFRVEEIPEDLAELLRTLYNLRVSRAEDEKPSPVRTARRVQRKSLI